jgi:hypothetical protein
MSSVPLKHLTHCLCFATWLVFLNYTAGHGLRLMGLDEAREAYGLPLTVLVVVIKLLRHE